MLRINAVYRANVGVYNELIKISVWFHGTSNIVGYLILKYIYIYIYSILGPVKPELGVIPSGQEIIHE